MLYALGILPGTEGKELNNKRKVSILGTSETAKRNALYSLICKQLHP